jgi:hypothetical protein
MLLLLVTLVLPSITLSQMQYATITLPPFETSLWDVSIATVTDATSIYNVACNNPECEWRNLKDMKYTAINASYFGFDASYTYSVVDDFNTVFYSGYETNFCSDLGIGEVTFSATGVAITSTVGEPQNSSPTKLNGTLPVATYVFLVATTQRDSVNALEL